MRCLRELTLGCMNLFKKRTCSAAPPPGVEVREQLLYSSFPSGLTHMPCLDAEVKEQLQRALSDLAAVTRIETGRLPCNPCQLPQLVCLGLS